MKSSEAQGAVEAAGVQLDELFLHPVNVSKDGDG